MFEKLHSIADSIFLMGLIPLVILDMIIHPDSWDDLYDDDPVFSMMESE